MQEKCGITYDYLLTFHPVSTWKVYGKSSIPSTSLGEMEEWKTRS